MADTNITFDKVVANPSAYSWAQAYNAGRLFAVLSLETKEDVAEKDYLNVLGKEILNTLEQEFFSLETKNLETIRDAIRKTSEKLPKDITCSFVVGSFVDNVLYIYILGSGKVAMKRGGKIGHILEAESNDPKTLKDASGYLQGDDIVILETRQFTNVISAETLTEVLEKGTPSDAAEHLAPVIHEKDEAGAAAIIIHYKAETKVSEEEIVPESEEKEAHEEPPKESEELKEPEGKEEANAGPSPFYSSSLEEKPSFQSKFGSIFSKFRIPSRGNGLTHPRKVILTIVILILVIFTASVIFAIKKQQESKNQQIFQSVYPQASQKYKEGESLLSLNAGLAQDSFTQAKQLLEQGKAKLPANSTQEKQIQALLDKVNSAISQAPSPTAVTAKQVDASLDPYLAAEINNPALYFAKDSNNIYGLTSSLVFSLDSSGGNKKTIITNNNDWSSPGGFSTYFGNMYILDKKLNQILKYVSTNSGYAKSDYISDNSSIDFSKAVSIAIDSSIYVLYSNGNIDKFTRGNQDTFSVSGLDKDFSNPTRIVTSADDNYIYVLDNGNSRIVVLDKSGKYKAQYESGVIRSATDLDVSESSQTAYVLSGGKIYEISLK